MGRSAAIGLALFSQALHWALNRHYDTVMAVLIGLMLGSMRVLWPWPDGVDSTAIGAPEGTVALPAALAVGAAVLVIGFNEVAKRRGQSLAQMAIAWVLRDPRVTSALIGASRPEQITDLVKGLDNAAFSAEELAESDKLATDGGINIWQRSSDS